MAPTRFASVRSQRSPTAVRKASFRDDTNLVSLRYEKTVQAKPPTPLPPRNPRRVTPPTASVSRSASVSGSSIAPSISGSWSTTSGSAPTSGRASRTHSPHPVIVAPPGVHLPVIAPPTEQHPALRRSLPPVDEWKRDSGLPEPPTSPSTVRDVECEDGCREKCLSGGGSHKAQELSIVSPAVQHVENQAPAQLASPPSSPTTNTPTSSNIASLHSLNSSSSSPSPSPRKRLVKKASVRLQSRLSAEGPTIIAPMDAEPLKRGFVPPASATSQPPLSPASTPTSSRSWPHSSKSAKDVSPTSSNPAATHFSPLAISIPTENLLEDDFMDSVSFSKRGSIMFGGQADGANGMDWQSGAPTATSGSTPSQIPLSQTKSSATQSTLTTSTERPGSRHSQARTATRDALSPPDIRIMTADVEKESQKVRLLYQTGDVIDPDDGASRHSYCERLEPTPEALTEEENDSVPAHLSPIIGSPRSASSFSHYQDQRRENELAGGLEDWEDVDGADIDRYGFITAPRAGPRTHTPTEMKSAQYSPRRRNVLQKRDPMGFSSPLGGRRIPSRKVSARSLNTQNSEMSTTSMRSSRSVIRQAGNLLPHNRGRRWMDEAGDMLTVSPSLQDLEEEARVEKISEGLKKKEWERSEKWRKMAKVVKQGDQGQGMEFDFDVKNPKLVERVWKGIPDRWRAAAWWSFMAASASRHKDSPAVEGIVNDFRRLQTRGSPDDVQIDLDVPRTISRHIMFRKRYRGGQRLLFRVLHALSIYFPETGYVQGMASLAATLLCYFDEEKCFVMLVRMWQLRGLDRLYRPGFEGLMAALKEFDTAWLNKDVLNKLTELCIDPTAYGTRWYLTLFNLSIPFPAQLRVWDVFLLLGDDATGGSVPAGVQPEDATAPSSSITPQGLDILHATSAALIQALREMLLDSDFENAMKALTSWIPIKDEDLLMKVTKAEWKAHYHSKRKA